jgi:hypothetical protein
MLPHIVSILLNSHLVMETMAFYTERLFVQGLADCAFMCGDQVFSYHPHSFKCPHGKMLTELLSSDITQCIFFYTDWLGSLQSLLGQAEDHAVAMKILHHMIYQNKYRNLVDFWRVPGYTDVLTVRVPLQQPGRLNMHGVCHSNELWAVMIALDFWLVSYKEDKWSHTDNKLRVMKLSFFFHD